MTFSIPFLEKTLAETNPATKLLENKRMGAGEKSLWDMIFEYQKKKYRATYSSSPNKKAYFGWEGDKIECEEI